MNRLNKNNIKFKWTKRLTSIILTIVCSLSLSLFIKIGQSSEKIRPWLSLIVDAAPEWYLNTYYNSVNSWFSNANVYCKDVVFFSLDESFNRKDLADLLVIISESTPKAVGLDYGLVASNSFDSVQTNYLIHKLNSMPLSFPLVYAYDRYSQSAIPDSLIRHRGLVNFYGYNEFKVRENGIWNMAAEMARVAGENIEYIDTTSFLVNFIEKEDNVEYVYANIFRNEEEVQSIKELAENKFVLIGCDDDPEDMHPIPFKLGEQPKFIPGSKIILYSLFSILTASKAKSTEEYRTSNDYHFYTKLSWCANFLISLLAIFLYVIAYALTDRYIRKQEITHKKCWWLLDFIKPLVLFIFIAIYIVCCMLLTFNEHIVPDVTLFIFMTVFSGFFYELFNHSTNTFGDN